MKMEEETRAALMPGGWLRSGDVAAIDADHEPNVRVYVCPIDVWMWVWKDGREGCVL